MEVNAKAVESGQYEGSTTTRGGGVPDDEDSKAAEGRSHADDGSERQSQPPRGAVRRRIRSRNPFIDAELAHGYGEDSFADLEDFIVCKRGRKY